MEHAVTLGSWGELYVMLGTSSAALIGLLYVVTSLHLDEITNSPTHRRHARSNTLYLILTLVEAVLVLTPQPGFVLGAEVALLNVVGTLIPIRNIVSMLADWRGAHRAGFAFHRSVIFLFEFAAGAAGGVVLAASGSWGIYLVTGSYIAIVVSVTLNAWAIMIGIGQAEKNEKRKTAGSLKKRA
jgi:hypothetical protein